MSVQLDNNKQMLFDLLKSIGLDNNMKINDLSYIILLMNNVIIFI